MPENNLPVISRSTVSSDHYYDHTAYLSRQRPRESIQTIEIDPETGYVVQPAFTAHDGATEQTSGRDRAVGLVIRLLPLAFILLILAVGVGLLLITLTEVRAIWALIWGAVIFAAMCLLAYNRESLKDYEFSRAGLERHRIDTAADLKGLELDYQFRLKRMLLKHQLKMLEAMDRDD